MTRKDFWEDIRWFNREEWVDDPALAAPELVRLLDDVRAATKSFVKGGVPIYVHVCWAEDGHSENSYHYSGQAVDFHFAGKGQKLLDEAMLLLSFPQIGGIGVYPHWRPRPGWHIDIRNRKPALLWTWLDNDYRYGPQSFVDGVEKGRKMLGQ